MLYTTNHEPSARLPPLTLQDRIGFEFKGKLGFDILHICQSLIDMTICVWIKVMPDGQPTMIACESDDNIDVLKRRMKEQLSSKFGHVDRDEIIVRNANGVIIRPSYLVSSCYSTGLGYDDETPFLVDAPAPTSSTGKVSHLPPSL
jgi:hypothetical protein